ncbi:MAG: tRNA pseudouridine(38-40) synthase TruA [Dehalococcoidaceae bacterium]|nr:tRNA pseudouridine(38-40) synthase TruA [Dehalococcoidaceae bacterium]
MVVEYDGTGYAGFQWQSNVPTIQAELETALEKLSGRFCRVYGSSRTDSGVHALGQVVSFSTGSELKARDYISGLNHYLPADIAVREAYRISPGFDVRRRAVSRQYRYHILNRASRSPLYQATSLRVAGELDTERMDCACRHLIGKHDFASFATPMGPMGSTIRRVGTAEVSRQDDRIVFIIVANAFLPHQVRNTVGLLIKVGRGRMTEEEFKGIMDAAEPGLAQPTAPAMGLVLYRVNYARELKEESLE